MVVVVSDIVLAGLWRGPWMDVQREEDTRMVEADLQSTYRSTRRGSKAGKCGWLRC